MTTFYSISHNTACKRGMPEIYEIIAGVADDGACPHCGASRRHPVGDLRARLGRTRAKLWPDAIACGDYPCFVVSERFVTAMNRFGVQLHLGGRITFVEPNDSGLPLGDASQYFWVDGKRHLAGKMDFEASGYAEVCFCKECGNRTDNIRLTHDRRHANPPPGEIFNYEASLGLDLFTTDLAPTAFFCTNRVLDCAQTHGLSNLAFCPVERGSLAEPLKY